MKITHVMLMAYAGLTTPLFAATPWKIVPSESTVVFTATQNNAPIKGKFTDIKGDIQFDPEQLQTSKVMIEIDTRSVETPLKDISDALKTSDWLESKLFPKANFETTEITKQDPQHFQAIGNLTIRNKTFPAIVDFTVTEYSADKALVKGKTTLKRTPFGVGQGDWASTNDIKDEVTVDFNLKLVPLSN